MATSNAFGEALREGIDEFFNNEYPKHDLLLKSCFKTIKTKKANHLFIKTENK